MTVALLAFLLLIVSAYAVVQHFTIMRLTGRLPEAPEPASDDKEAGVAILELLEAKLTECPDEWADGSGAVTHKASGTTIAASGNAMVVSRGAISFAVPDDWRPRIERACQLRNARELVEALTTEPRP